MTNYIKKIGAMAAASAMFAVPMLAWAQSIGIPCNGPDCEFKHLVILANRIIHFIVFDISVPLAALGFMWLGVQVLLHPNEAAAKSKAKEIAGDIAMGFGVILGAFLLIKFVLYQFISSDYRGFLDFIFQQ